MNNFKTIVTLLLGVTLTFASCKKNSDSTTPIVTATIGGTAWKATTRTAVLAGNTFTITASSLVTGQTMMININGITPGTYNLDPTNLSTGCSCTYNSTKLTGETFTYLGTQGTVTLTEVDTDNKTISGTFSFTVYNITKGTLDITNGSFSNLEY